MLRYILTAYWISLVACSIVFASNVSMSFSQMSHPTCKIETVNYWDVLFPARLLGCGLSKMFKEIDNVMSKDLYRF